MLPDLSMINPKSIALIMLGPGCTRGELIEGEHRLGAGTYVVFGPNSDHWPRSETGVTLPGFNLCPPQM